MLRVIKTMPGAQKIGRDWTIRAADYEAWATAEDIRRCANQPPGTDAPELPLDDSLDAQVERSIAAAGFRRSK